MPNVIQAIGTPTCLAYKVRPLFSDFLCICRCFEALDYGLIMKKLANLSYRQLKYRELRNYLNSKNTNRTLL